MLARVHLYRDHIALAKPDERRGIHAEGHVAVIPLARQVPVDVHLRESHDSIEVEVDALPGGALRRKHLAVEAHALPGQLAGAAVAIRDEGSGDGPIVRQADRLPRRVVKAQLARGFGLLAFRELPVVVELLRIALAVGQHRNQRPRCGKHGADAGGLRHGWVLTGTVISPHMLPPPAPPRYRYASH